MIAGAMSRRIGIAILVLVLLVVAFRYGLHRAGKGFTREPSEMEAGLSPGARALVARAFEGIDPSRLLDYHVHVVGLGTGGTGAFVSPEMRSWWHVTKRVRFEVYRAAAGITDLDDGDRQYVERLRDLVSHIDGHGRHLLLPFDRHYGRDGLEDPGRTEFFTPNAYVREIAASHPGLFVAAASVHPYRKDALVALEREAAEGARIVKWLPNAMGIDPSDARCVPFYRKMRELSMALLTHAGEEQAVDVPEDQALGNPLRLRVPLDTGVKVIVAHCASLGEDADLDSPGREPRLSFDLFLRLMDEKRYEGLVFGEISATPQANRLPGPLLTLLRRRDLHPRLVNGSDYPLPAVHIVLRTRDIERAGFVTAEERRQLNEIYDYNPLLFDFVLKRTLKEPGTTAGFAPSVFMEHPDLPPGR